MRADDGAGLMTLIISSECANPPTLAGGSVELIDVLREGSPVPFYEGTIGSLGSGKIASSSSKWKVFCAADFVRRLFFD